MDGIDAAFKAGFDAAIERVAAYAKCIPNETGDICVWFAENCKQFTPATPPTIDKEER